MKDTRSIDFLCPECGQPMRRTTAYFDEWRIWQCSACGVQFYYVGEGWRRIPPVPPAEQKQCGELIPLPGFRVV
jgi:ribosomal protein L37AE/L43A